MNKVKTMAMLMLAVLTITGCGKKIALDETGSDEPDDTLPAVISWEKVENTLQANLCAEPGECRNFPQYVAVDSTLYAFWITSTFEVHAAKLRDLEWERIDVGLSNVFKIDALLNKGGRIALVYLEYNPTTGGTGKQMIAVIK